VGRSLTAGGWRLPGTGDGRLLVAEMNAYLDSLAASVKVFPASAEVGSAPDIHFGCRPAVIGGDCIGDGDENGNHELELSVGRPSQDWIGWLGTALDSTSHDKAFLVTLELGQYWPRQKGLSLGKEVRLGSDHTAMTCRVSRSCSKSRSEIWCHS